MLGTRVSVRVRIIFRWVAISFLQTSRIFFDSVPRQSEVQSYIPVIMGIIPIPIPSGLVDAQGKCESFTWASRCLVTSSCKVTSHYTCGTTQTRLSRHILQIRIKSPSFSIPDVARLAFYSLSLFVFPCALLLPPYRVSNPALHFSG